MALHEYEDPAPVDRTDIREKFVEALMKEYRGICAANCPGGKLAPEEARLANLRPFAAKILALTHAEKAALFKNMAQLGGRGIEDILMLLSGPENERPKPDIASVESIAAGIRAAIVEAQPFGFA